MIAKTKEDQGQVFPYFFMANQALNVVNKVRYLGHIFRNDLCDDDVQCQRCKLYAQANMLAWKFHMCTDDVKTFLEPTVLHSIQPTCSAVLLRQK